jgi:hypothetical protein
MQRLEVRMKILIFLNSDITCLISSHFYVCKYDREHEEEAEKLIEFSIGILIFFQCGVESYDLLVDVNEDEEYR